MNHLTTTTQNTGLNDYYQSNTSLPPLSPIILLQERMNKIKEMPENNEKEQEWKAQWMEQIQVEIALAKEIIR